MDLPRSFTIRESSHHIHNPFTSDKLATLGQALSPQQGTWMLDVACGTGEMLCTWARDHQVTGTGIDISRVFIAAARARAVELARPQSVRRAGRPDACGTHHRARTIRQVPGRIPRLGCLRPDEPLR